ncbi:hypothetical protein AC626_07880 [Pseudoalteromonas rubra]|uniref:Uncharacterized protein n=2 Tax=Pseudoalteromonas TaxID=53246 RepID=A0A0L0EU77_9GAMM|nr:hypothetical protein AC626_07880 [Pseudoalteromonas rubra]
MYKHAMKQNSVIINSVAQNVLKNKRRTRLLNNPSLTEISAKARDSNTNTPLQKTAQRMLNGFSLGPDTGADRLGQSNLDDMREEQRQLEAQRAAERQRIEALRLAELQRQAARRTAAENAFAQMRYQLSGNARGAWNAIEAELALGGDEPGAALAYRIVNEYLDTVDGSVNADREQYGGALGYYRR